MKKAVIFILIVSMQVNVFTQSFESISHNLPNDVVPFQPIVWADMDNDGDYDALFRGKRILNYTNGTVEYVDLELWQNNGSLQFSTVVPAACDTGFFQIADMDNDNDLDIVFSTCILVNNGKNSFKTRLHGRQFSKFAIADMNNDGWLDIVDVKYAEDTVYTGRYDLIVYKNKGKYSFEPEWEWQQSLYDQPPLIGDIDADGDIDIAVLSNNLDQPGFYTTNLHVIDNELSFNFVPNFVRISSLSFLQGSILSNTDLESFSLADFDNDGDLEYHLTGYHETFNSQQIFYDIILRYEEQQVDILRQVQGFKSVDNPVHNDFDHDGDLDYMLMGMTKDEQLNVFREASIFLNNGLNTFTQVDNLFEVYDSETTNIKGMPSLVDIDRDEDVDIIYSIPNPSVKYETFVYRNKYGTNSLPSPPSGVQITTSDCDSGNATITWNPGTDVETPQNALKYNLRIGTTSGGTEIKSSMAMAGGQLLLPIQPFISSTSYNLQKIDVSDTLYISVQTIDGSRAASPFSQEITFAFNRGPFQATSLNVSSLSDQVEWGDYDGDGDYDILSTGKENHFTFGNSVLETSLQINNGGSFTEVETDIPGLTDSQVEWGDMDTDGDLDLLMLGKNHKDEVLAVVCRNDQHGFVKLYLNFYNDDWHQVSWFDMDGDGDLDIIASGKDNSRLNSLRIYRFTSSWYEEQPYLSIPVEAFWNPRFLVFDAENDGFADLFIYGDHLFQDSASMFLSGHANGFTEKQTNLPPLTIETIVKPIDTKNQGINDLLILKKEHKNNMYRVYMNDGTNQYKNHLEIGPFEGELQTTEVTDFDNDGFPEIFLGIQTGANIEYQYLENVQGNLSPHCHNFPTNHLIKSVSDIGDPDGDGDVDILVSAIDNKNDSYQLYLFENRISRSNSSPEAPENLTHNVSCDSVMLAWEHGSDPETPVKKLRYRIQITDTAGKVIYSEGISMDGHLLQHKSNPMNKMKRNIAKTVGEGKFIWNVYTVDGNGTVSDSPAQDTFYIEPSPSAIFVDIGSTKIPNRITYKGTGLYPADFDLDGDLDLLVSGAEFENPGEPASSVLLQNTGGIFDTISIFPPYFHPHLSPWLDVNQDGYPDLIFPILDNSTIDKSPEVYLNSHGTTIDLEDNFFDWLGKDFVVEYWGHINTDGFVDYKIFYKAHTYNPWIGQNSAHEAKLCGYAFNHYEPVVAADLDGNPGLDYIYISKGLYQSEIKAYIGNQSFELVSFDDQEAIPNIEFADYDNDGDMDVLISSFRINTIPKVMLFEQNENGFQLADIFNNRAWQGYAKFADYDGDGDVDIFINGENAVGKAISEIYQNQNGHFNGMSCSPGVTKTDAVFFDMEQDGDLDFIQLGVGMSDGKMQAASSLYENQVNYNNQPPMAPEKLTAKYNHCQRSIEINWTPMETVPDSIKRTWTYDLKVGTLPGTPNFLSTSHYPLKSQSRRVNRWTVHGVAPGETYYISMRAQNTAGTISENSREIIFEVPVRNIFKYDQTTIESHWSENFQFMDFAGDSTFDALAYYSSENTIYVPSEHTSFRIKTDFFPFAASVNQQFNFYSDTLVNVFAYHHLNHQILDYNSDGWLDLLVQEQQSDSDVDMLYVNLQNGNFLKTNLDSLFVTETASATMRLADLDNDNDLDIINGREIYQQTETGITRMTNLPLEKNINQVLTFFDYNNDGWLDLLVHKPFIEALFNVDIGISIYENHGDFVFTEAVVLEDGWFTVQDVEIADMNNDGYPDIVLAAYERDTERLNFLGVYSNLHETANYMELESGGHNHYQFDVGDIDLDGFTDIAVVGGKEIHYCWGLTTRFFRNIGDKGYSKEWCAPMPSNAENVQILDTDFDGRMEIVASKAKDKSINSIGYENIEVFEYLENESNEVPKIPSGLESWYNDDTEHVVLNWEQDNEEKHGYKAFTYALNLGEKSEKYNFKHAAAHPSGLRKLIGPGNVFQSNQFEIKMDIGDTLFWTIQSIDQAHKGSSFSKEQMIVAKPGDGYIQGEVQLLESNGITLYLVDANNGDTLRSATTDGSGRYRFRHVPGGSYKMVVCDPETIMSDGNPTIIIEGEDSSQVNIVIQDGSYVYQITEPVQIDQPETRPMISMYPNPANDWITITIRGYVESASQETLIQVYDPSGRQIHSRKTTRNSFNIQIKEWGPGIYLVRFIKGKWQTYRKFAIE